MQIEDVPSVREFRPDREMKQGTMEGEIKIELDEHEWEIAKEA